MKQEWQWPGIGWQWVPKAATQEMIDSMWESRGGHDKMRRLWSSALAAAIRALKDESAKAHEGEASRPAPLPPTPVAFCWSCGAKSGTLHDVNCGFRSIHPNGEMPSASASRRDEPSPEIEREVMPIGPRTTAVETSPQPTGDNATAGAIDGPTISDLEISVLEKDVKHRRNAALSRHAPAGEKRQ